MKRTSGRRRRPNISGLNHTTEEDRITRSQQQNPALWAAMAKLQKGEMTQDEFMEFVTIQAKAQAAGLSREDMGGNMIGWRIELANGGHAILCYGDGHAEGPMESDGWSCAEYTADGQEVRGACAMSFTDAVACAIGFADDARRERNASGEQTGMNLKQIFSDGDSTHRFPNHWRKDQ